MSGKESPVERLKRLTEEHLRRELDIMEEVLKLSEEEAKSFYQWYMSSSGVIAIREVVRAVRGGTDKEVEGCGAEHRIRKCDEEGN